MDDQENKAPEGVISGPVPHRGEPRWAMAVTVLAAELLHIALPSQVRSVSQVWIYPVIGFGLLLVLVIGDPGRIDNRATWLRVVTGLLIASITLDNAFAAVHLVKLILTGASLGSPTRLLAAGAVIWLVNAIAFGLWYWDLDRGGAAARAAGTSKRPAFLFPEMTNAEWVEAGWYPSLMDYLHMSFAISAAFSPTDVSAIKHWSKMLMTFQSAVSLLLAVLVVARAINILPS